MLSVFSKLSTTTTAAATCRRALIQRRSALDVLSRRPIPTTRALLSTQSHYWSDTMVEEGDNYTDDPTTTTMMMMVNAVCWGANNNNNNNGPMETIARQIVDCGGQVHDTRATRLGDLVSLMMEVSIAPDQTETVRSNLFTNHNAASVAILRVADAAASVHCKSRFPFLMTQEEQKRGLTHLGYLPTASRTKKGLGRVCLTGADHPGIMEQIVQMLKKEHNADIQSVRAEQQIAPHGGTTLFSMEGVLMAPKGLDPNLVCDQLEAMGDGLNCEATLVFND